MGKGLTRVWRDGNEHVAEIKTPSAQKQPSSRPTISCQPSLCPRVDGSPAPSKHGGQRAALQTGKQIHLGPASSSASTGQQISTCAENDPSHITGAGPSSPMLGLSSVPRENKPSTFARLEYPISLARIAIANKCHCLTRAHLPAARRASGGSIGRLEVASRLLGSSEMHVSSGRLTNRTG